MKKFIAVLLCVILSCACAGKNAVSESSGTAETSAAETAYTAEDVFVSIKSQIPEAVKTADVSAEELAEFDNVDITPFEEVYACRQLISVDLAEVIVARAAAGRESAALASLQKRLGEIQAVGERYPEQARAASAALTGKCGGGIFYMICAENAPDIEKFLQESFN